MADLRSNYITERDTFQRVEVITGVARRRRWPRSDKARIVAESYATGASATAVAVRHGLHRNQIFAWRRQLRNRAALTSPARSRRGASLRLGHW
jgi:transposase